MPNRRLALPLAASFLLLCALPVAAGQSISDSQALHLLHRLGFGPTAAELRHVETIGANRYIDEQLDPAAIPEPIELTERLAALDTLRLDPAQLFQAYGPPLPMGGLKPPPEAIKERRERARIIVQQAAEARILRAVLSHRQLQEVMVDFWYHHFNVFAEKGLDHLWVGA